MQNNTFLIFLKEKKIFIYLSLYITLIVGFIFNENSTGGALVDYNNQKYAVAAFSENFKNSFLNYEEFSTRHSPLLIIILSFLYKVGFEDIIIRAIHLHISLFLPFVFYLILKKKFSKENEWIFIILIGLIFLSPTFRTLAIWPDSRLIGLIFFSSSILYYLKFEKKKKFIHSVKCIFLYTLSAYFSPNFSVFSIFFMIKFINEFKVISIKNFILITLNLILAVPALYYVFILDINFINKSAAVGLTQEDNILFINIFNTILITISLIFFYLIPFIITKIIHFNKLLDIKNLLFSIIIYLILIFKFNYDYNYSGGGIIFRSSQFLFDNNIFFFIFCFFSSVFLISLLRYNYFNLLFFLLVILSIPQYTIYHKYFDPFLIICFFSIFNFKIYLNKIYELKNIFIIYFYFLFFLIINNLRFLWNI